MVTSLPNQFSSKNGDKFHINDVRNQQLQTNFKWNQSKFHIRRDYAGESKTNFSRETVFPALKVANNAMETTTNSRKMS